MTIARPSLAELYGAIPGLRGPLVERARTAGLLVGCIALLVVPAWTVVDRVLAPDQADLFLVVRLLADLPMLCAAGALWRLPIGRRYAAGDEALRAVADLLRARVRDGDLVARLGGDEIGVLLPGTDLDRAGRLADSICGAAALLAPAGLEAGELTLSLGVTTVIGAQAYPLELMSCADAQLYRAKITRNAVGRSAQEPARSSAPGGRRVTEAVR